jgi:hypothetical protein
MLIHTHLKSRGRERTLRLRVPIRVSSDLSGRDVAYAAMTAVAAALRTRRIREAEFVIDDPEIVRDLEERRSLPMALVVPYVTLRCELNRFSQTKVLGPDEYSRDLSARSRAELALTVAA